jgi:hypothetical protein
MKLKQNLKNQRKTIRIKGENEAQAEVTTEKRKIAKNIQ